MKKNVLALSIATMVGGLGLSGAAMAAPAVFDVNESGAGVIQIVPYFTAQDGNATVLHVVNTDADNGKIVKVRFRGASNSDDLLDFQVFLSPGDVWTGLANADADGLLQLVTSDSSCTLPEEVRTNVTKAQLDRLTNRLWDTPAKKNAQTREGYIEILEMATVPKHNVVAPAVPTSVQKVYTALKHVKNAEGKMVAPCTLSAFKALDTIKDGKTFTDTSVLTAPTGALSASWYIMNVAKSTTFSGSATALALKAGSTAVPVYSPQKAQIESTLVTADPLIASGAIDQQDFDVPDLSTPLLTGAPAVSALADASTQAANLSAALNRATVGNQFYQDAGLNAATDWVFSMPTRRYLVAANYAAEKYNKTKGIFDGVDNTGAAASATALATAVVDNYIFRNKAAAAKSQDGTLGNKFNVDASVTVDDNGRICVQAKGQTFFDRDEDSVQDGHVVSPGIAKKLNLCGEVHVATFGATSTVGASLAKTNITTGFGSGWGVVDFGAVTGVAVEGNGVPVLGSAFTAASNPNAAAGMVGNYGITWPHFYTKK